MTFFKKLLVLSELLVLVFGDTATDCAAGTGDDAVYSLCCTTNDLSETNCGAFCNTYTGLDDTGCQTLIGGAQCSDTSGSSPVAQTCKCTGPEGFEFCRSGDFCTAGGYATVGQCSRACVGSDGTLIETDICVCSGYGAGYDDSICQRGQTCTVGAEIGDNGLCTYGQECPTDTGAEAICRCAGGWPSGYVDICAVGEICKPGTGAYGPGVCGLPCGTGMLTSEDVPCYCDAMITTAEGYCDGGSFIPPCDSEHVINTVPCTCGAIKTTTGGYCAEGPTFVEACPDGAISTICYCQGVQTSGSCASGIYTMLPCSPATAACSDSIGNVVCSCPTGSICPAGNSKTCIPTCASNTASCSDSTGTATCVCPSGSECPAGNSKSCTIDACASATASCSDATGTATCACPTGSTCPAGNSQSCTTNAVNTCASATASCSDATGTATCTCPTGSSCPAGNSKSCGTVKTDAASALSVPAALYGALLLVLLVV